MLFAIQYQNTVGTTVYLNTAGKFNDSLDQEGTVMTGAAAARVLRAVGYAPGTFTLVAVREVRPPVRTYEVIP